MTRLFLLAKYEEMAYHNLLCYSKNYAMTVPKEGYEDEHKKCKEEIRLLNEMIADLKRPKFKPKFQERTPLHRERECYCLSAKCFQ